MKPVIGVTPQLDAEQGHPWARREYFSCLQRSGALPVLLPVLESRADAAAAARRCDGLLFTGGPDPHPALFGEDPQPLCGPIDCRRDAAELFLFEEARREEKPVLGICRGIQIINVALGGTLWQDIPGVFPGAVQHMQQPPYETPLHRIELDPGSLLEKISGSELLVNSIHHQAIRALGEDLSAVARTSDGLIEAVCGEGGPFLLAVQWHPEYLYESHREARSLFHAFVDAARHRMSFL